MNQTELMARLKRAENAANVLGDRLQMMVNAFEMQGQLGCAMAFDAGMKIAELERELDRATDNSLR